MKGKNATQHKPSSAKTDEASLSRQHPTKLEACLYTFLEKGKKGIHTLDQQVSSFKQVDHYDKSGKFWTSCLNTDVSILRNSKGILIDSRVEPYYRIRGNKADFKRYWIGDASAVLKAIKQYDWLRDKRGLPPLNSEERERYLWLCCDDI